MPIRPREYHRSSDPVSAAQLLQRAAVRTLPIPGGPRMPIRPYAEAEAVVDLRRLQIDAVSTSSGGVQIGGQATLQALIDAPALQHLAGGILPQAAQLAAHLGLRHLATVGGLLLAADSPPEVRLALLALDASVVILRAERLALRLIDYQPQDNDLVLGITFSPPAVSVGGGLARVARTPLDHAIVAAVATAGPDFARVAVAGASAQPLLRVTRVVPVDPAALARSVTAEANPVGDYRGSAEYRRAMAGVLAGRALEAAYGHR